MSNGFTSRKFYNIVCSSLLVMSLVACGMESRDHTNPENDVQQEAQVKTKTLVDAIGNKVQVPVNPKRIIASYLEDHLVALGVTPVAQWSVNDGTSIQNYLQDALKDVPVIAHDLPFETVQSYAPDLILMESAAMVEGDKYAQYSKIAPTYVVDKEVNNDWRAELLQIGEVLGMKDQAEDVLKQYDEKIATVKAEIAKQGEMPSTAAIWLVGGSFFVVGENVSSGAVMYEDLGLKVPEVVKEISASATANWSAISLEKLVTLDADYIFLINSDGEKPEVLSDKLWQSVPAVKAGHVYTYSPNESWLYSGAIANTQIIDDIQKVFTK